MKKSFKGKGRPVLVTCNKAYATGYREQVAYMILMPLCSGFGAATYFRGERKISHSLLCMEYDGFQCKYEYDFFNQATDEELLTHLKSPLVSEDFRECALELIKECPLEE